MANSGHTIGNARWEAGNVRDVLHYYAAAPERLFGRQIPVPGGVDVTFREPLGVVGVIVPWNFPMPIAGWGFAPALAAGNTVVLKPAELTPLTALRLGELACEAGIPEDVFQVLPGKGSVVGQRFVDASRRSRKIVFTGSTEVGKQIMAGCAGPGEAGDAGAGRQERQHRVRRRRPGAGRGHRAVRRCSTTPGRTAAPGRGSWSSASVYDRFMELLEPAVQGVRVGDPARPSDRDGAADLGGAPRRGGVVRADGRAGRVPGHGAGRARVLVPADGAGPGRRRRPGGRRGGLRAGRGRACRSTTRPTRSGWPTTRDYGLSGSIWTRDVGRALRVARGVEAGNLSVNSHSSVRYWTPFGGFKQSGLGRELGPDALDAFTEVKNVFIATED